MSAENANVQISKILQDVQKVDRTWGFYTVIKDFPNTKVKELVVSPNSCLSFQQHEYRHEFWIVNEGVARVILSDDYPRGNKKVEIDLIEDKSTTVLLHKHDYLHIPIGTWHQLINPSNTPLSIVEIQYGEECVEEDIKRLYQ